MSWEKFTVVNCAYIHCMVNYGIILCKNIPYSVKVFKVQKNVIAIITGGSSRISSRDLLKILTILSVQSQYIFHPLLFVVNNKHKLNMNYDVYSINTIQKFNFWTSFWSSHHQAAVKNTYRGQPCVPMYNEVTIITEFVFIFYWPRCILIFFVMKTSQMHYLSLIDFVSHLYMFRACLLPIIRRYSLYMYSSWCKLYIYVDCQST
jgi:hypothetical protein